MGKCCTRPKLRDMETLELRPTDIINKVDYRWFWSISDNLTENKDGTWAQYNLELCDQIEKSYHQKLCEHNLDKDCIIKFNYINNQHFQIEKKATPGNQRKVIREIPYKVQNVIRIDRIGHTQDKAYNFFENNYLAQLQLVFYSDIFRDFDVDQSDPLLLAFASHVTLIDKGIASFLTKEYANYLKEVHQLNLLNFNKVKDILCVDLQKQKTKIPLHSYVEYYIKDLTQENFHTTIAQMYTEEGQLYKNLNQVIRCMLLNEQMEYAFYFLCFLFIYGDRQKRIEEDIKVFRGTACSNEQYEKYKTTYAVDQVIINYDFMSTTRKLDIAMKFMKERNLPNKILFEILVEKESDVNQCLTFKPFDVMNFSKFPDEEEIILPPNGVFQVKKFKEKANYTKIQMEYRTNLIQDCKEFVENSQIAIQFGFYQSQSQSQSQSSEMTEENYKKIITLKRDEKYPFDLQVLSKMKNLQHLDYERTSLNLEEMKIFAAQIGHLTHLQHLSLAHNNFDDFEMIEFSKQLVHLKNLQHLDLSYNNLSNWGLTEFSSHLIELPKLEWLNLRKNRIRESGITAFAGHMIHLKNLKVLLVGSESESFGDYKMNKIGPAGMRAFAAQLCHLPHLRNLDLQENDIEMLGIECLVKELNALSDLRELNLSYNTIKTEGMKVFVAHLILLPNLQKLNLNCNRLKDAGIAELASKLCHFPNLLELKLSRNRIGDKGIEALSLQMNNLPKLQVLDLSWNRIGDEGMNIFVQLVKSLKCLQQFDVSGNKNIVTKEFVLEFAQLKNLQQFRVFMKVDWTNSDNMYVHDLKLIDSSWANGDTYKRETSIEKAKKELFTKQLAQKLILYEHESLKLSKEDFLSLKSYEYYQNLKTLDISSNEINKDGITLFASELIHLKKLQHLHLNNNEIGNEGMKAFAAQLVHLTSLQELDISKNKIREEGISAFAAQACHLTNLQKLNLNGNYLSYDGMKALAMQMVYLTNLQELNLRENYIEDEGMFEFAEYLPKLNNLQKLDIAKNQISVLGMIDFANKLCQIENLQNLDLSENNIGVKGIAATAGQLFHVKNLRVLNLSSTEIGDDSITAFAKHMNSLSDLQVLVLSNNKIGQTGMKAFALQAVHLSNLQELDLSSNSIGDDGLSMFIEQFTHLTNLKQLKLMDNHITPQGIIALAEQMQCLPHLEILYLKKNTAGTEGKDALLKSKTQYLPDLDLQFDEEIIDEVD